MSNAFAPMCGLDLAPSLADLFIIGVAPIDYGPILLLRLFGFRIAPDTLSSTGLRRWPARHYPCLWIQRPSSERWRDFNPPDSRATQHTLRSSPPLMAHRYFQPRGWRRLCLFPWHRHVGSHVPYRSLVELRAAYMPDAARAASGCPRADPGGRVTPRFRHRLIRFRHFIGGSLALASLNRACRDHVPAFPRRSPPSLLTTAARGGLRPAPDCRPRRALLHLSYSSAPLHADGAFVTHAPNQTSRPPVSWAPMPVQPQSQRVENARKPRRSHDHCVGSRSHGRPRRPIHRQPGRVQYRPA